MALKHNEAFDGITNGFMQYERGTKVLHISHQECYVKPKTIHNSWMSADTDLCN